MTRFPHLLEGVEIARVGVWGDREMTDASLQATFDDWFDDDSGDPVPIQVGHGDAEPCGEVVDLEYLDGSLIADLMIDDATLATIRDGDLIGISIDNADLTLNHIALLDKPGAVDALPPLQSYLDDLSKEDDMPVQDFSGFKFGACKSYVFRPQQWQREDRFSEQRRAPSPPPQAQTPQQAGARLAGLVGEYQAAHPGVAISGDAAMAYVRSTAAGEKLYALWASGSRAQTRSYGTQNVKQEGAVRGKQAAAEEIDRRAKRFALGAAIPYSQAVLKVLSDDPLLRAQYEAA